MLRNRSPSIQRIYMIAGIKYIDRMVLDLDLLLAFQTVVDCGGFTRAAERLHRTQSTVSMQIKRLEQRLDRRLLDREARGVALTPEGERLLGHARRLLALNDETLAAFAGDGPQGHVRIGTPADYASAFLGDLLPFIARRFPGVTIQVESDLSQGLMARFDRRDLDLALVTRMPGRPDGTTVHRSRLVWVSAPGANALHRQPLPLALFPVGCHFREVALDALRESAIDYRIVYESPSMGGIEAAVGADFAVAAVAADAIPSRLMRAPVEVGLPTLPETEVALFVHERHGEPAASIADYLRRQLRVL